MTKPALSLSKGRSSKIIARSLGSSRSAGNWRHAPSAYHRHAARRIDPEKRPARARRDDDLKGHIRRVHEASFGLYGTRKVWRQLLREKVAVARCAVERLMKALGLAGV